MASSQRTSMRRYLFLPFRPAAHRMNWRQQSAHPADEAADCCEELIRGMAPLQSEDAAFNLLSRSPGSALSHPCLFLVGRVALLKKSTGKRAPLF